MNYAVLGLGMMGEAIIYDLLTHDVKKIYGFELNPDRRSELKNKYKEFSDRFETIDLDLDMNVPVQENHLITLFKEREISTVFGAIDYKFNVYLSQLCILSNSNYLDLGGNPDIVNQQRALNKVAKDANVTIIPDLGLAPGMANVVAYHILSKFEKLKECHIRVGGLPQPEYKKSILNYQQVFSIRGLTNEYLEDAIVIRDGKKKHIESMTEIESLEFPEPYGSLEAFQTSGGTSSLPILFEEKITELTYKTIRYPGHAQFFKFLKDFEMLSSDPYPKYPKTNIREVVEYYLQKNLPKGDPDTVLIRITVTGIKDGQNSTITYQLIDVMNPKTGFTSMARTTSYPISIIGQMIHNNKISQKGVVMGEVVTPENEFMSELKKRNINFQII